MRGNKYMFIYKNLNLSDLVFCTNINSHQNKIQDKKNSKKESLGQYFTPPLVANFMADMFLEINPRDITLLDPGAGSGILLAAFVERILNSPIHPKSLSIDAYEVDSDFLSRLESTLLRCEKKCEKAGINFKANIYQQDFIEEALQLKFLDRNFLFPQKYPALYSHVIMNPPYRKIKSISAHRKILHSVGIETTNLYSAFVSIAIKLLTEKGELVAITPRSFCNGPYFKSFRELIYQETHINHIHIFEARDQVFKNDEVLQENIIYHLIKDKSKGKNSYKTSISTSFGTDFSELSIRKMDKEQIIDSNDLDRIIVIPMPELEIADSLNIFKDKINDLDINISTGPIVDFRLSSYIKTFKSAQTVPLIYPYHFKEGFISWPQENNKKNDAIEVNTNTQKHLLPNGYYVLVRRFSSKEERKRVIAAVYEPISSHNNLIGFENHINVFHSNREGLTEELAKGLSLYLNSSFVDAFFRKFSGHTQVNVSDLKMLPFPDKQTLTFLGQKYGRTLPDQKRIDSLIKEIISDMGKADNLHPLERHEKVKEALDILQALEFPKGQLNDRSARTLLAMLNLKPSDEWEKAQNIMIGITPIMDFIREHYNTHYAPNTRETIRRQTVHQFLQAGIAIYNPDEPMRAPNSPKTCYKINDETLNLVKKYGTPEWEQSLARYKQQQPTLKSIYAKKRNFKKVPVKIKKEEVLLTPGKHSSLIKKIIEEFCPRFVPGGEILYIGDTENKQLYVKEIQLKKLGLSFDPHGKMPDVVIYSPSRNWLILAEAVTSHGPVDSKRHIELQDLFKKSKAGLIYLTAFLDKKTLVGFSQDISWETEVWIAETPDHLIHFDGERFLGPYNK